jgi:hypothetical protein
MDEMDIKIAKGGGGNVGYELGKEVETGFFIAPGVAGLPERSNGLQATDSQVVVGALRPLR